MPDAGRQILRKKWSSKSCSARPSRNMSQQKQSEHAGKGTKKKELKRNPKTKKKRVEMKMKRNKEGRPKQNWSLTR